ncbi:telomere binding protein [Mortierella sp. AD011]|nr:telomere binding protein [Mortierella sp. AD011]
MADSQDSEAISAYLTDLQNQVRASPSPTLSSAIRVLSEPLSFLGLINSNNGLTKTSTSTTTTTPLWAGPIEPTFQKRLYFIQHLLPNHLDFILDNITLDWFYALPSAQQTSLFDVYFIPCLSLRQQQQTTATAQFQWEALMAVVSVQTLVSRINARFHENHSFLNETILRLLRKVLESYSLMDFYQGCYSVGQAGGAAAVMSSGGTKTTATAAEAVLISAWDSFLSKLFSIPTRVSNTLGGNGVAPSSSRVEIEGCFRDVIFFKRQATQLQSCLSSLAKGVAAEQNEKSKSLLKGQHARAYGVVITKFLRLGYAKILVESMVSQIWDKDMDSKCLGWELALTHTASPATVSQFLVALVEHFNRNQLDFESSQRRESLISKNSTLTADQQQQLDIVHRAAKILVAIGFGTSDEKMDSNKNNNNAMVEQILFQGRVYGIGVLRMLICVQSGWPTGVQSGKDSILAKTFKKALEIWSDSMLVNHASADYQKYMSYQVLLMIGYFSQKDIFETDLISIFSNGMSNWLELESFQRKQIGLDGAKPYNPALLPSIDDSKGPQGGEEESEDQLADSGVANQEDSDDEEDPDEIVDQFSRVNVRDDSDSDDDDDLKPYEMEYESDPDEDVGSSRKPKIAAPLYLRDLVSYLRAGEDRDKTEMGLQHATELIRRKAGSLELEEFAETLANTLVQIQDSFDLTNFYKMRENALIALVVTSPIIVSGVLTFQFYEKKNSIGQRLNILTALALGAQEISGFDRSPSAATSSSTPTRPGQQSRSTHTGANSVYSTSSTTAGTAASSTSTLVGAGAQNQMSSRTAPVTFDSIASNISLARTRRFSQKSNIEASRPAPKANAFSNLAPVFLGGLLGRWGGNRGAGMERGYDVLQKAPAMVLKKFVVTLGVLVHYAVPITRELFRFLFALRYHTPPSQPTPGGVAPTSSMTGSAFSTPSLTSLKLPGEIGISTKMSSTSVAGSSSLLALSSSSALPYNPDLLESILFDLLILVTPSSATLSDELLLHEFYAEVMECQQWAMELWEVYKLEEGSGDKARMYCAALLQRCFELMEVSM